MVEKKVYYPTREELCRVSHETKTPTKRELTKMAIIVKTKNILGDKITVTKKANDTDLYISEELERMRIKYERGVKSRNKRKEEEI